LYGTKKALLSLDKLFLYIAEKSVRNAEKVLDEIQKKVKELPYNPEKYPIDKYKKDNDGNFRAFELYRIRIAYYIDIHTIRVISVRSTHQEPLEY
jgi:plasmid stabilization system protein ParE